MNNIIVLALLMVPQFLWAESQSCPITITQWTQKYGGSDPYIAQGKTTPFPLWPRVMKQLGKAKVDVQDVELKQLPLETDAQRKLIKEKFLSGIENHKRPLSDRDLAFRENLKKFVETSPVNALSLAYMGVMHSADFFINYPELNPTYINKPFNLTTQIHTPEYRQVKAELGIESGYPDAIIGSPYAFFMLPFLYTKTILTSKGSKPFPDRAFKDTQTKERTLVFSEIHYAISLDWINELPSAECLKQEGIDTFRLAMEGYRSNRSFSLEDMIERHTLRERLKLRAEKAGLNWEYVVENAFSPALAQKIIAGQVTENLPVLELVKKLITYRNAGIKIELSGLETPTFNELDGTDK